MLSWINPAIVLGLGPFILEQPPVHTSPHDIVRVGDSLSLLLRMRGATLPLKFVAQAVSALTKFPYKPSVETMLAVAWFHPNVLLNTTAWHRRELYVGWFSELRLVLDLGVQGLEEAKRSKWSRLRDLLLDSDAPPQPATQEQLAVALLMRLLNSFED